METEEPVTQIRVSEYISLCQLRSNYFLEIERQYKHFECQYHDRLRYLEDTNFHLKKDLAILKQELSKE